MTQTISQQNLTLLQDLFNKRNRALFREKTQRYALSPVHEAALLYHICVQQPVRVNKLSVIFEVLLCGQTIAATTARHSNLNHANAAIDAALAVDVVLARKNMQADQLPRTAIEDAYSVARRNGYHDAARAIAPLLSRP